MMKSGISAVLAVCAAAVLTLTGCARGTKPAPLKGEIHVAAASNLTRVLAELATVFEKQSGYRIVPTYGSTAQLTQQIENGAPVDLFLSADAAHVDQLIREGHAIPESRAFYARGHLVIWAPMRPDLKTIDDMAGPNIIGIIVAKPELSPYGAAAIESLKKMGLWDKVEKKIVYAPTIQAARQFVDTRNGDAAFTALSLIVDTPGNYFIVDESTYTPIDQALCVLKNAKDPQNAREFIRFLEEPATRQIFMRYGYGHP